MTAYYNEHDPKAAAWLRELIRQGLIANGDVDERSITDVVAADLVGYTQCHFFAGIGGWSCALRLAGWPDDRPVWTGSPPCQPFSSAGRGMGREDARHLGPHFVDLVRACRPGVLFGEQVASAAVLGRVAKAAKRAVARAIGFPEWAWWDDLSVRLEHARYAVGASDIPAAGIGAPHIRQRCFFGAVGLEHSGGIGLDGWRAVEACGRAALAAIERPGNDRRLADADGIGQQGPGIVGRPIDPEAKENREEYRVVNASRSGGLDDAASTRHEQERVRKQSKPEGGRRMFGLGCGNGRPGPPGCFFGAVGVADTDSYGSQPGGAAAEAAGHGNTPVADGGDHRPGSPDGFWGNADWLFCRDGKWRPVEPGTFPLAHGVSARVGRLRGYGNAIVPQAAAEFIAAFSEAANL